MIFTLSAAMRFHSKPIAECAVRSSPRLGSKAKALVAELRRLEAKDIKKQLHVNEALAKQYEKHLTDFEKQQPVPACCLYDSPLFNSFGAPSFDEDDAEWANRHVRILSGLYGMLRPFDEIQSLSLPIGLNTKLKNSKGNFLYQYWKEPIIRDLEESMQRLPMPVIVNCAAEEDTVVLDREALPEGTRIASVEFKIKDRERREESLGQFVQWAMQERCMTVDELLEYRGLVDEDEQATFQLNPKLSSADSLVFEQKVGAGGDGGWRQKMAEYDGSRKKFVKEFASGKQRHMRTEINKSLAKESKKRGKGPAVY